jgi:hypothetical protein
MTTKTVRLSISIAHRESLRRCVKRRGIVTRDGENNSSGINLLLKNLSMKNQYRACSKRDTIPRESATSIESKQVDKNLHIR